MRRGRPLKEPSDLITLDEAVKRMREYATNKYSATVAEAVCIAKGTLYNKISMGTLHAWKKNRRVLVSEADILKLVS